VNMDTRYSVWSGILRWAAAVAIFVMGMTGLTGICEEFRVCVTTQDIADFVRRIGGKEVNVFTFARGPEDPHGITGRPSFVKELGRADLVIVLGRGVESEWLGRLIKRSGNDRMQPEGNGYLDLSVGAGASDEEGEEHEEESGEIQDFHEEGNPHYLLDPVEGLRCVSLIATRLSILMPEKRGNYVGQWEAYKKEWVRMMLGESGIDGLSRYPLEFGDGDIIVYENWYNLLKGQASGIGGLEGLILKIQDEVLVGDHDLWYFYAKRFGLKILGYIEEHPGIAADPGHLKELITGIKENQVKVILKSPYFPKRSIDPVVRATGVKVVRMAHQTGGLKGFDTYIDMIEKNTRILVESLEAGRKQE
jgi:ABC-type Zn uptake system ZnuABC Zn-binding protein ZnuA